MEKQLSVVPGIGFTECKIKSVSIGWLTVRHMSFWWWMLIRENIMPVQGQSLYDITLISLSSTVNLKQPWENKVLWYKYPFEYSMTRLQLKINPHMNTFCPFKSLPRISESMHVKHFISAIHFFLARFTFLSHYFKFWIL